MSRLREEVQWLETVRLGKIWLAVAGSEVEGVYGLLWGAMLHSSRSSIPPPPKNATNPQLALSPCHPNKSIQEATPEASTPAMMKSELAPEVSSPAAPEAAEEAIPTHVTPLCLQLGDIKRMYKCWVEGCKEGPLASHATICAHVQSALGVGLMCPFCSKTFFNLDALRCHSKSHATQ